MKDPFFDEFTATKDAARSAEWRAVQQCRAVVATVKDGIPDDFWNGLLAHVTDVVNTRARLTTLLLSGATKQRQAKGAGGDSKQ